MRRLSRTGCLLKWLGTIACVLIVLCDYISMRRGFRGRINENWWVRVSNGALCVMWWNDEMAAFAEGYRRSWPQSGVFALPSYASRECFPSVRRWGNSAATVDMPFWIIALAVAIPTAPLWWFDRRAYPLGHCVKCGYDLTGNVSGHCPECGEPT
jgi:hypothetical protein